MKVVRSLYSTALIASLAQASSDGKCRALVLSGGSNNGAWEAGVIYGLAHYGDAADFAWDVVSGISTGSINASGIATWATGTEVEMTEWLSDKWAGIKNKDVWVLRKGNPVNWLLKEPSLVDDSPALALLKEIIGDKGEIARRFTVGAVDANTGDFIAMNQDNTVFEDLAQSALSSGSIPVAFAPQHLNGHVFMDGGTVWNANLNSAVLQCLDIVDNVEDIIVDVVIDTYLSDPTLSEPFTKSMANYMAARDIKKYYGSTNSLIAQARAFPGLKARYYFQEHESCGGGTMDFNNATTWCKQLMGRRDAQAMLDIGSDNVQMTLEEWSDNQDLKKEHPNFRDYLNLQFSSYFQQ